MVLILFLFYQKMLKKLTSVAVTLSTCIWDMLGSNECVVIIYGRLSLPATIRIPLGGFS